MMPGNSSFDRRQFLRGSATCAGVAALLPTLSQVSIAESHHLPPAGKRIYTSVKWGMIEHPGSVLEKFQLCKDLGYAGMELISPIDELTIEEINAASAATGMPVHGVVDMKHWDIRLSSPDEAVRAQAVEHVRQAIIDCHGMNGFSVLLVPGKVSGSNESHDDVWNRSIIGIRQVLATASKLGVRVLIENVWNGFCEKPEQLRDYLDEIDSPWVGAYFDIGNVRKFSPSEEWIKVLGSRIVKLDVKDWGAKNGFCKIGDGDVDWPAVRQALDDIEFTGWCTAEVTGGGEDELRDIQQRMNKVLDLG